MGDRPTIVVVGAATRDRDRTDRRGWRLGGSVSYAAIAAAALGAQVHALLGVDAETATAPELDVIRRAGVDVRLHELRQAPVFDNRHTPVGRVQHAMAASDALPAQALPDEWRDPDAAVLAPVAGELRDDWSEAFGRGTYVGLAAQGLMRHLVPGHPVERVALSRTAIVERADAILVSAEDVAGADVALADVTRAGQVLLVTHGDRGAIALDVGTERGPARGRYVPPLPRRTAIDTTGAGDTFLAAYVVGRVLTDRHAAALNLASVVSSLSVERATLAKMPTRREVCEALIRLRDGPLAAA